MTPVLVRLACFCLALLGASPALALCEGRNQIEVLAPEARAELVARVAAAPFAQGNHWRATRGDETVTLIGTYHLPDPRFDEVMQTLEPALAGATTLLVEAGPMEQAELQAAISRDPSLVFVMDGPTLPEVLDAATWDRLKAALFARGVPPFLGAKMQPAYLAMLLGLPACAAETVASGEPGLDQRLIIRAEAIGLPVRALEPYDTVFGIFAGLSAEQQREMLVMSLALEGQSEDAFATMQESYFAEDSRMIWEYSRLLTLETPGMDPARVEADFAAMEAALMTARNRAWIPVIEAAAAEGPVLAAFGALHLSGENGVLALLAERGFALERHPF